MKKTQLTRWLYSLAITAFLTLGPGKGCAPAASPFREKPALIADASQLAHSDVTAILEAPVLPGKNLVWCATFQLAWNHVCDLAGGPLQFQPPANPLVAILNRRPPAANDMDPKSYLALAGYVQDDIYGKISRELRTKFPNGPKPKLLPATTSLRPHDIVAYAYLFKQLDFPTPFERLTAPLEFRGAPVASFGMGPYKPGHRSMAKNVTILDYQSADDFIIELKTRSPQDHLILAKIAPGKTLAATIMQVATRIKKTTPIPVVPADILAVPKMNFDLTRRYEEILGLHLLPTAAKMPSDAVILAADQNIRFLMDEKGVQLQSESHITFGCSAPERTPPPTHELIFNQPFLLLLSRTGSTSPYLALWIENPELLVGQSSR